MVLLPKHHVTKSNDGHNLVSDWSTPGHKLSSCTHSAVLVCHISNTYFISNKTVTQNTGDWASASMPRVCKCGVAAQVFRVEGLFT